jgi:effector-binding domain-containing protein
MGSPVADRLRIISAFLCHMIFGLAILCLALLTSGAQAARLDLPGNTGNRAALAPLWPQITLPPVTWSRDASELTTLAPASSSPDAVDTLRLVPRPTIALAGQGRWDDGAIILRNAFATLYRAASDAGLTVTGRPFAIFSETDEDGYSFEVMLPITQPFPVGDPRITVSESPGGFALRFVHQGPFEEIDLTYDIIASHLEAEGLEPQDRFIEEFVTGDFSTGDVSAEAGAVGLEGTVYIYVFPQ